MTGLSWPRRSVCSTQTGPGLVSTAKRRSWRLRILPARPTPQRYPLLAPAIVIALPRSRGVCRGLKPVPVDRPFWCLVRVMELVRAQYIILKSFQSYVYIMLLFAQQQCDENAVCMPNSCNWKFYFDYCSGVRCNRKQLVTWNRCSLLRLPWWSQTQPLPLLVRRCA